MPSWIVHRNIASLLRLNPDICSTVDTFIDSKHLTIAEVIEHINKLHRSHQLHRRVLVPDNQKFYLDSDSSGYLWHDFGCKPLEYPIMYSYVYEHYGTEGCMCLTLHCVLDHITHLIRKGYTDDLVLEFILDLIDMYRYECLTMNLCVNYTHVLNLVRNHIIKKFSDIMAMAKRYVQKKLSEISIAINALSEILRIYLKLLIFSKEYRGKHGFHMNSKGKRIFMKLLPKAKKLLYEKLCNLAVQRDINIENIIKAVNDFRIQVLSSKIRTIADVSKYPNALKEYDQDFAIVYKLIMQVINELRNEI